MWLSEGGGKSPNNIWWNGVVQAAVERKEAAWNKVFGSREEVEKE